MDLGTPGIGHSRDLSLLHLTLQVCSDRSWQQSTGQLTAHHSLSLCWSQHSMDLGWSVELGTLGWSVELAWTWAGLWNWALHGPGLVCGIGNSMDLGWSVELGTPWTWAGLWNWALHGPGLVCGIGHSMDLGCLHPGPSGIRGSMGLGFVVPLDMGHSKDLGSPQLSLTLLH